MELERLKILQNDKELMDDYIKWKESRVTKFVLDLAKDVAISNASVAIPPIPVQGVLTEICALRDRRTAGFVECLDTLISLDTMGALPPEMPEEDYRSSVVDVDNQ